jgi:hypothetical protein
VTRLRSAFRRTKGWLRDHRALVRNSAVATLVFLAAFFFTQWWDFTVPAVGRAHYQAVFLVNGQTYFGRYYDRLGAYAKIEDVYYLQQVQGADPNAAPDTKLIRRGKELDAPAPRMLFPKTAILFVEDLSPSSRIAQFMDNDSR